MFIGHALIAFAVAALVADWRGWDRRPALIAGGVAGAFAAIPDIDVAYALVGLANAANGSVGAPRAFWDASRAVHRSVTHSLVVGAVAAPAFGLLAVNGSSYHRLARLAGSALLVALVAIAFVFGGPLAAVVTGLFVVSGAFVATVSARWTSLSAPTVAVAAFWGLWSHPWGDLVTGSPPDLLFPFGSPVFGSRVVLHSDPTLHLLGAFAIELAAIWLAFVAICRLTDRSIVATINRRAAVGVAYGVAALAVTPPTLEVSYHFVYSILAVGFLCGAVRGTPAPSTGRFRTYYSGRPTFSGTLEVALTMLMAITLALAAYATVYIFLVAPA
ncbi:metal-dependent hydrolase [Natrinema halophilum]|uniref:Metal-dependent hydrolase n=1 Tax=Natrinema halophilum TaxID=1699371 RepID=A0A7D5KQS8_9EURY|nr:metal-dependent hydrolase [Natrinema halophilum]QLG47744.1 metal-dependent hydrolase [Natrinema halophilum]